MSKTAKALLKKINDKKNAIRSLQGQGKTQEMRDQMEELRTMQEESDMLMDLEDDDDEKIKDSLNNGGTKNITDGKDKKYTKAQICRAFVNRIVCGLRKRPMEEEDKEIMDSFQNKMSEGSGEDGGFTVPDDVRTDIIELRRTENDLEQYVNTEHVTTKSGSRVIEVDADSTPWKDVDEGEEFQEEGTPTFRQIKYTVKKKGGILKVTKELFEDTAYNIMAYINKWIAKKTKATRNAMILKVLDTITAGNEVVVSNLDSLKDIFNVQLDPAIAAASVVITNQNGFNYLDKLKDTDGNYILQPDPTQKTKGKLLFGEYPVIRLSKKTLKSTSILAEDGQTVTGYKHPVYCGDLKEAIALFDRNVLTIDLNDKGVCGRKI